MHGGGWERDSSKSRFANNPSKLTLIIKGKKKNRRGAPEKKCKSKTATEW